MVLRPPTPDDLRRLAQANHFELNDEEMAAFMGLIPEVFPRYEELEQMIEPREPQKYTERQLGARPTAAEDPFNAIIRRCSVKGAPVGKLAGKRFGLKNNISVAGMPMTSGSAMLQDFVAETDATVVARLLDEGAEIVALLNLEDLSFSGGGDTSTFGPVLNPHNPEHLASGSSGGSGSALYYDDIDITLGADQGGSIRMPASWCGVVGHKPTFSLVPYTGIMGADHSIDHVGPMARSVADAALTLEVIAGADPMDPRQTDVSVQRYTEFLGRGAQGLRIGILKEGFGHSSSQADVDASVRHAVRILGDLGAEVSEVSVPDHLGYGPILWGMITEGATALLESNGMGHGWEGRYDVGLASALGRARKAQSNDFPPTVKFDATLRQLHQGKLPRPHLRQGAESTEAIAGVVRRRFAGIRPDRNAHHSDEGPPAHPREGSPGHNRAWFRSSGQYRTIRPDRPPGPEHPLRQVGRPSGRFDAGGTTL